MRLDTPSGKAGKVLSKFCSLRRLARKAASSSAQSMLAGGAGQAGTCIQRLRSYCSPKLTAFSEAANEHSGDCELAAANDQAAQALQASSSSGQVYEQACAGETQLFLITHPNLNDVPLQAVPLRAVDGHRKLLDCLGSDWSLRASSLGQQK